MFNIFKKKEEEKKENINEWSYQRFGNFYGENILPDKLFSPKISKVLDCIKKKEMESIEEIAKEANCTYDECLIKIKYLKNKRALGDYYIDYINKRVSKCEPKDLEILNKYREDIYFNHASIEEMAYTQSKKSDKSLEELKEEVYNDIVYLFNKGVLNGIKLDNEKKTIIYYTVEKKKIALYYNSINCPYCGVLIEVPKGGSEICSYCNNKVDDIKKEK